VRLSFKFAGGLDLATPALILSGVALVCASFVAAATQLAAPAAPAAVVEPSAAVEPDVAAPAPSLPGRPSAGLSADQVATVLFVDASMGAGTAARSGDHVDVLGYFSRQVIGSESLTRTLLQDALVLSADHSGPTVALTLAVPHAGALLLQEAQAIGARPFVTLRSAHAGPEAEGVAPSFSDTDLAARLAGVR